jgi:spermidine/putrescine transport system ATP-binding protein
MRAAELALQDVSKSFDGVVAVERFSMAVPPGSYVVLLGPSGSGKSTVLSMLGGFVLPSSGRILIGGEDVSTVPPAKRPTATVFQDYALFPHLTVAGNIGFGLSVRGLPKAQIAAKVGEALDMVGLAGFGNRTISATSGGQRQRIALARALVTDPAVLLLDEPLGALDLALRRQMQDELRRIQRAQSRSFVHVTHDQEEAMAIADLLVIMRAGRIEDAGPPERVYSRPRTRFAATFMGESTILEGRVAAAADGIVTVDTTAGRFAAEGDTPAGTAVALALRPEQVHCGVPGPGDQPLGTARIEERVFQGSFVRLRALLPSGARILAKVGPAEAAMLGDTASLHVRQGGFVLLRDESELR